MRYEYEPTVKTLCKKLGITTQAYYQNWKVKKKWPGKRSKKGYNYTLCQRFKDEWEKEHPNGAAKKNGKPAPDSSVATQQEMEIETASLDQVRAKNLRLLDIDIQKKLGKLVPMEERDAAIAELCHFFIRGTEQLLNATSAITKDPRLVKRHRDIIRNIRQHMADKLRELAREKADESTG